ncbi:MAG: hypothetical protein V2I82_01955 [Halieaceae bacterium]|nr:hypothetical protein [Halieaceae bacterium]
MALPVLALLVGIALFVFFALPRLVEQDPTVVAGPPTAEQGGGRAGPVPETTGTGAASNDSASASPYADAVEARARAEAQELLGELIDVRENLENRGALDWAASAMEAIAGLATQGDEQYRERAFDEAIASYRAALDQALALEGSLPQRFEEQLEAIEAAVEALDVEAATAALVMAERLEAGAPEIDPRRERVEALPAIVDAVAQAESAEAEGDLVAAVDALDGAAARDPQHQRVARELARLRDALTSQRFNAAMSEGYAALDEAAFDRAETRFKRAAALRPGSSEAEAALSELGVARTAARLQDLRRRAEASAGEEDWETAIKLYEEALAIDSSLRFAREGLADAQPRAEITRELGAIIEQPERLVDDAILAEARASLAKAEAFGDAGAKLAEQRARVADIITVASRPLPVRLRSDGETEVTVYKVARLGSFEERELELRPGTYVAVGRRPRYRDVRVEFTVGPDSREPVLIACNEPISF